MTASFASTGNGITLTDTAGGGGTLAISAMNFSEAATDLGLGASAAVAGVISGTDVNAVRAEGDVREPFRSCATACTTNDQAVITAAAEGLQEDFTRVSRIRGQTGARVQELESREQRIEDQNVATKSLLSSLADADFTDAITRFQTLQTAIQATLQTATDVEFVAAGFSRVVRRSWHRVCSDGYRVIR